MTNDILYKEESYTHRLNGRQIAAHLENLVRQQGLFFLT
jgi:hypothetical protein